MVFGLASGARAQSPEPLETHDLTAYQSLMQTASQDVARAIANHDYAKAERLLIDSIQAHPAAQGLLPILGGVFFLDAKYLNCASALEKANKAGILNAPSRFTLAMAYINLGRLDLARPELEVLIEDAPAKSLYRYWIGRVDFINQRFESGIQNLNVAKSLDPQSARVHDLLGLCYEALSNPPEALAAFKRAVILNRDLPKPSPGPPFDLGEQLYKLGRYVEAEPYIMESLRYEPKSAKTHFQLGLLFEKSGRDDKALNELRTAVALDSRYPEPYFALARILRRKGELTSAEDAARQFEALSTHP